MNQKGFFQIFFILIVIAGIGITVYLTQFTQVFKPKAAEPQTPMTNSYEIRSTTIHTTQFDTPLPSSYQSGWEKPEIVPFTKTEIDRARKIGFNTIWLVFPWQRRIPETSLLNEPALNNLKKILTYAQSKDMKVILPLNYCSAGWCWGAPGSSYLLSTDPILWQKYQDYTKALITALNTYPNVNYLLFSENMVPQVAVLRNPSYPQYKTSFSNFWQTQNGNLSFLNSRWGTNFSRWAEVLPPPDNLTGANQNYIQDYYQWSGNVIKNTLSKLTPELQILKNPESKIGYHDYLWNHAEILGSENGIPEPNPYDFLSIGMYPDWNNVQNYINEPDRYIALLNTYKSRHPNDPIFIGELGADSNTYPPENNQYLKQSYYINQILEKAKTKIFGFNVWELIEYNDQQNPNEGKFGLIKLDGTYKEPTVSTLRNNFLRPIITSSGITNFPNSRAIWIIGQNLHPDLIYIVRSNGAFWLDYQKITYNKQTKEASFLLPNQNVPDCQNTSCDLQIVLWDPIADLTSNSSNITLPTFSAPPTSNPSQSPSPTVIPSPPNPPSPSPSSAKPGDTDGNNQVDIFDYNLILTNYGKTGANLQGDFDKNNKVDIFDYNTLISNYGK